MFIVIRDLEFGLQKIYSFIIVNRFHFIFNNNLNKTKQKTFIQSINHYSFVDLKIFSKKKAKNKFINPFNQNK